MMIGWAWDGGGGHAVDISGIDGDMVYNIRFQPNSMFPEVALISTKEQK
jgi:hypothetical protein